MIVKLSNLNLQEKHLNFLFSIFLTFTLLLNSFSNIVIYVNFKINQNEIAKTLCVLRKQKNNTCNGHCVLRAELKKQANNEKKYENTLKEKTESIYTIASTEYQLNPILFAEFDKVVIFEYNSKPNSVSFSIFQPPTV
ncbi:conserved hypothetical protein [Flavobacterium psychrophilum]|nr:conserved hypothetical protein [Flavobacterium psychrophilum]